MKTKFKTPKKIRVAGDWIMKYFRYIVSGFAILYFGIVLNFCPISENLQLNKIMLSLFLSYILKTMLEKYLKEKINKIIREQSGETDFETLLVIDSTTGQNGLEQARIFNEIVDLTGIILTKFDGTAKGGIIFPITEELKKPIKFIGVGEGIEDLREFDTKEFVEAMFD